jgi:GT2 family glycosyltransferase
VFCKSDIFRKASLNIYKAYASRSGNCCIGGFPGVSGNFKKNNYMTELDLDPSLSGRVYCIIVTYNGMTWLEKCLGSLVQSNWPVTVLVVDNRSSDATIPFIRENFPQVRLIGVERNLGFGQANNIGLRIAMEEGAAHIFLLNQDAWVEKNTIADLVKTQRENPQFGLLSPLHLNGDGTALDDYFAGYLLDSDVKEWVSSCLLGQTLTGPPVVNTSFVNAAAWMISAACLRKTGGFDPIFFHYGEDLNYSQRVLYHRFFIGIHMGARIFHDREQRLARPVTVDAQLKKDRIHFLNQACDIRVNRYRSLILRRAIRYSLLTVAHIFTKEGRRYYFNMAKTTVSLLSSIRKSRRSATGDLPFLPVSTPLA